MRVLHYVPVFSQLSETFIYNSIQCLEEHDVQNAVVTDRRLHEAERPFSPVHVTPPVKGRLAHWRRYLQLYQFDRAWTRGLTGAINSFKPDLIQAHFGMNGYRVLPVARRMGVPVVTAFHGFDVFALGRRASWRWRYRSLQRYGAAFTFVSNYMLDAATALGFPRERSHIIHVGVREEDFPFTPPSQKEFSGTARLISIGSLVPKKGHADLIRAVGLVNCEGLDAQLTIIGEGSERPALELLIAELGLSQKVRLLGAQHRERVREELGRAHLFALASRTARDGNKEGIPTVMMEAQASGAPVVSTLHSGIPEVIPEPYRRWLAPEGSPEALARCLADAIRSRAEWDQAAHLGRDLIREHFSLPKETAKLIHLYESVSNQS